MIHTLVQGDTPTWVDGPHTDAQGKIYTSTDYGLLYVVSGPTSPTVLHGLATSGVVSDGYYSVPGNGWSTSFTAAQSAALNVGKYFWDAQLTAAGFQLTIRSGELHVSLNLANAPAGYDGRTNAEKIVAQYELAFTVWQSGGRTQAYTIDGREMRFQQEKDILDGLKYWRARVFEERSLKNKSRNRNLLVRFQRAK
jgi:hypothetical protein